MNMNQLAKEIAKREGLKVQLPIGQIKEVLRILTDLLAEEYALDTKTGVVDCLHTAADKRAKKL